MNESALMAGHLHTSPEIDKLAAALAKAQAKIKNPAKNKTAEVRMKAGGTYKYDYADLADVLDALRAPFADNGLALIQPPTTPQAGIVEIITRLMHESGQWVESSLILGVADNLPQTLGAAITYGRRYAACGVAGIAPDADNDANESGASITPKETPKVEKVRPAARKVESKPENEDHFDPKNGVHVERLRKALVGMGIKDEDKQDKIGHRLIGRPMVLKEIETVISDLELPF